MTFHCFDDFSPMGLQPDGHLAESYPWPAHDTQWNGVRLSSKTISLLAPDLALDSASSQNLSNMQRYLCGPERPLFSAHVFPLDACPREHSTRSYHLDSQYDAVGPWHYHQTAGRKSPDHHRSSWSASSSSSYNNSLPEEPSVATFSSSDPSSPLGMASQDYVECTLFSTYRPDDSLSGSCALREIQQYPSPSEDAEQQMDYHDNSDIKYEFTYEQEVPYYPSRVENGDHHYSHVSDHDEGLQVRVREAESVQPLSKSEGEPDSDYKPSASGPKRRPSRASQSSKFPRRLSSARKSTDTAGNRVSKRPKGSRFNKDSSAARPFPCPLAGYSCQATFASKNEWKRHVSTQHIRLGFWRCELCPNTVDGITTSYNDFNRKDLFAQHLRRMHFASSSAGHAVPRGPSHDHPVTDENIADYLRRCYIRLRDPPPKSCCLFCSQIFEGTGSWDERMEHVGRHFEKDKKPECSVYGVDAWRADDELRDWLCSEGLVECDHRGVWQLGDGTPRRREGRAAEYCHDFDDSDDDDDNDGEV